MRVIGGGNLSKSLERKIAFAKGQGAKRTAERIARVVAEGNTADRLAGVDANGLPMVPVKLPRTGAEKGKTGPPLAPNGQGSRVVTAFRVVVQSFGSAWEIVAGWPSARFLGYHDKGAGKLPRRGISGMSPTTRIRVRQAIDQFKREFRETR